mgnify:CR=1 FL=1
MSNLLRSYRRNILRQELSRRGAKKISKKVTFSDKDEHKSRFARAFFDLMNRKEKAK